MSNDGYALRAVPLYEELRQAEVFACGVLAMRDHPVLGSIVRRAAALMDTPIAAISVIDRDRQWFPAYVGAIDEEIEREASFCAHAILQPDDILCVTNAASDARFATNRLVTDSPSIRFYAGAPIVNAAGAALGALCTIDTRPRSALSGVQAVTLRALAREAAREIDKIENLRRFGADAIHHIVMQIREAARRDDEVRLLALDRVLQSVEQRAEAVDC